MPVVPEFSRPLAPEGVPPGGLTVSLTANPEECAALARRFDLARLDRLEGEMRVERAGEDLVHLAGHVRARLAQSCVVTFEPVEAEVDAEFERLFSRSAPAEMQGEVEIDPLAELPEPVPPGGLDLGEILAEELALALDPYPHAPGAEDYLARVGEAGGGSAFAALRPLKRH